MSEKYTVESYVNESKETVYKIRHSTKTVPFIETFDGDFMELICLLLNENEANKSLPKLTRDEIDLAINDAQDNLNYYNGRKTKDEDIPRYKNIIKFLESLECE